MTHIIKSIPYFKILAVIFSLAKKYRSEKHGHVETSLKAFEKQGSFHDLPQESHPIQVQQQKEEKQKEEPHPAQQQREQPAQVQEQKEEQSAVQNQNEEHSPREPEKSLKKPVTFTWPYGGNSGKILFLPIHKKTFLNLII